MGGGWGEGQGMGQEEGVGGHLRGMEEGGWIRSKLIVWKSQRINKVIIEKEKSMAEEVRAL